MDLTQISVIDHHAHNLVRPEAMSVTPFTAAFSEGYDPAILSHHARYSLCYRRSLKDLANLLGCESTESAILQRRAELGLEYLTRHSFQAANLSGILMDDGFLPDTILPLEWHQTYVPTYRLLRLEWLAERLIAEVSRFEIFIEWFRSEIDPPPADVIGFKSVAAYRTGLDIQLPDIELATDCFYAIKDAQASGQRIRLMHKPLIDLIVHLGVEVAAQHQLPVQFHSGFGDPDLDLRLANPLHLRSLFENPRYRSAPLILLHAAYPFMREAGFLTSVYPNAYVDIGLAVPLLSVAGMRQAVQQLLELSPTTKVIYSSDAHLIPELYYLGAKWGRDALGMALEQAIADGDLNAQEAEEAAIAILQGTTRSLYRLDEHQPP